MTRIMFWGQPLRHVKVWRGYDENCNPSICLTVWPFGTVIVFWRPKQRTELDGPCLECRVENIAEGCCEWCGCRPCGCCDCILRDAHEFKAIPDRLHMDGCLIRRRVSGGAA